MADITLQSPVSALSGVGPKRTALYEKLKIRTVEDLLRHYPRGYLDFSESVSISEAPLFETAVLRVQILSHARPIRTNRGQLIYNVMAADDSAAITIVYYQSPYRAEALENGKTYYLRGKIDGNLLKKRILSPEALSADGETSITPLYPLTEGLFNRGVQTNVQAALQAVLPTLQDDLPADCKAAFSLIDSPDALRQIHSPANRSELDSARRRLIFDELLSVGLGLRLLGSRKRVRSQAVMHTVPMRDWYAGFPYELTDAQKRAIADICADLRGEHPMNRLLQGDVGSGKTSVAATAAYFAAKNGYQTALLAPTEILAEQHLHSLQRLFARTGLSVGLLTGSTTKAERTELLSRLQSGALSVLIGTHALIESPVQFANLGLIITDEQHRFGVNQRAALYAKGCDPHVLVMSATPIPRTLALMLYGDLALSVLDSLPPGRQPITTRWIRSEQREVLYGWMERQLAAGRQAYVVCPAIEENEAVDLEAATAVYERLTERFAGFRVALLHGKMKGKEKDEIMRRFSAGETQILVSTTVIEVGVDVPNATVMVIENAERFGLSQLHQLRGRVGRGVHKSSCVLISDTHQPESKDRLEVMCQSQDGFFIAEQDLRLRGPGDFFGQRQSGLPVLQLANLLTDASLTNEITAFCDRLLQDDPQLQKPENAYYARAAADVLSHADRLN